MELVPRDDQRVVALAAALEPSAWTRTAPEMLVRRALGVLDRHWLLGQLPGPQAAARLDDTDPADPSDERVTAWVGVLHPLRRRALTRAALCRQLVSGLDAWGVQRRMADIELAWLLDGGA